MSISAKNVLNFSLFDIRAFISIDGLSNAEMNIFGNTISSFEGDYLYRWTDGLYIQILSVHFSFMKCFVLYYSNGYIVCPL